MIVQEKLNNMDDVILDDIVEFINAKGLDKKCYICENDTWDLIGTDSTPENNRHVLLHLQVRYPPLPPPTEAPYMQVRAHSKTYAYQCFSLICTNCSHVRVFAKYKVKQYKEEKAARQTK